jgi:hypothetical protein
MTSVFETKEKAEKACRNVQEYLDEQQMYLEVEVHPVDGGYVVAIVNCY